MKKFAVILAAAGKSSRFGDLYYKKVYAPLGNRPVWVYAAEAFSSRPDVGQIVMVIDAEDRDLFSEKFAGTAAMLGIDVAIGGVERSDSVWRGIEKVRPEFEYIAIHDAARPCLAAGWVDAVFQAAKEDGAAILAKPIYGTIKRVNDKDKIVETVPRQGLWEAQTPQVFRRDWLLEAFQKGMGKKVTDDAQMMEQLGHTVRVVTGSPMNIKITTKEDLRMAEQLVKALPKSRAFPF